MKKTFAEVLEIKNGRNQKNVETPNGRYPIYGSGGIIGRADGFICNAGTVIIGRKGTINNPIFVNEPFWNVDTAFGLEANRDVLYPKYLFYFCKNFNFESLNTTVTIPSLTKNNLLKIKMPIPPLPEQQKIAAELDKIQSAIDNKKQQLALLDEAVKSEFVEMFGENPVESGKWKVERLEDACSSIVDCPHTTPKYEGELKNPAIRTSEIKKGYITWDSMRYVSDNEYEERTARLRPENGDIVYGREGTFGNAAILPKNYKFCLGQRVMLLRPDYSKCVSEYLLYTLISDFLYQQALDKNRLTTVAHVNVKDVKNFKVPIPPLELQNQFSTFVQQIDEAKSLAKQQIADLQELLDSKMQEDFG